MSIETTTVIKILELAATYGIPAIIEIINSYNKIELTLEDIEQLKNRVKKPEEYFK